MSENKKNNESPLFINIHIYLNVDCYIRLIDYNSSIVGNK